MKIVKITKVGLFYKVKFDNDEVYKFHESIIISFGFIRKGIEVDSNKLNNAIKENEYYIALDKGINYLSAIRSKKEVFLYLKKHYDNDIAIKVLSKLEESKLINDLEYAKSFVSYMNKKGYGRERISLDLKENNINFNFIEEALEEYSREDEIINCEKAFLKYLPKVNNVGSNLINKKIANHLRKQGFSNEIITITLEKYPEKLDNVIDEDALLKKNFQKLLKSKKNNIDEKKFKGKVIRSLSAKGFPLYKILKLLESDFNYD